VRTIRLQDLSERLGISRERGQQQEPFLALLLLCLSLGIFLASSQMLPQTALWVLFLLAGAIGGGLLFRQSRLTFLAFCLLFLLGGALRFMAADRLPADDISRAAGQEIFCRGILQGEPVVRQDAAGIYHVRYEVEAREVRSAASKHDNAQSSSGHLYIYAQAMQKSHLPEARVGDEIRARGKVRLPHGYRNPGQIDIVRLLRAQGITASLATGKQGVKVVPQEGYAFQRWLVSVKQHYRTQMEEVMPREEAAAVFALLFGGYEGISPELVNDFTTTGIVHILSVSGSHISLLAAVMAWLGFDASSAPMAENRSCSRCHPHLYDAGRVCATGHPLSHHGRAGVYGSGTGVAELCAEDSFDYGDRHAAAMAAPAFSYQLSALLSGYGRTGFPGTGHFVLALGAWLISFFFGRSGHHAFGASHDPACYCLCVQYVFGFLLCCQSLDRAGDRGHHRPGSGGRNPGLGVCTTGKAGLRLCEPAAGADDRGDPLSRAASCQSDLCPFPGSPVHPALVCRARYFPAAGGNKKRLFFFSAAALSLRSRHPPGGRGSLGRLPVAAAVGNGGHLSGLRAGRCGRDSYPAPFYASLFHGGYRRHQRTGF
jgi:hypothetical protein